MITTGVSSLHRYSVLGNWGSRTHEVTGFLSPVIGTQSVNFKAIFRAAPIESDPLPRETGPGLSARFLGTCFQRMRGHGPVVMAVADFSSDSYLH